MAGLNSWWSAHGTKRGVELWPHQALAARIWELGANLSSYYAAYVALAEAIDADLIHPGPAHRGHTRHRLRGDLPLSTAVAEGVAQRLSARGL